MSLKHQYKLNLLASLRRSWKSWGKIPWNQRHQKPSTNTLLRALQGYSWAERNLQASQKTQPCETVHKFIFNEGVHTQATTTKTYRSCPSSLIHYPSTSKHLSNINPLYDDSALIYIKATNDRPNFKLLYQLLPVVLLEADQPQTLLMFFHPPSRT